MDEAALAVKKAAKKVKIGISRLHDWSFARVFVSLLPVCNCTTHNAVMNLNTLRAGKAPVWLIEGVDVGGGGVDDVSGVVSAFRELGSIVKFALDIDCG